MTKKKVLVAGASGLVGFAAVRHFASLDEGFKGNDHVEE